MTDEKTTKEMVEADPRWKDGAWHGVLDLGALGEKGDDFARYVCANVRQIVNGGLHAVGARNITFPLLYCIGGGVDLTASTGLRFPALEIVGGRILFDSDFAIGAPLLRTVEGRPFPTYSGPQKPSSPGGQTDEPCTPGEMKAVKQLYLHHYILLSERLEAELEEAQKRVTNAEFERHAFKETAGRLRDRLVDSARLVARLRALAPLEADARVAEEVAARDILEEFPLR